MEKIDKEISGKLCRLLSFLHLACEEFEKFANKIKDKKIKVTVRGIIVETNQYKRELNAQLQSLNIKDINISDSPNTVEDSPNTVEDSPNTVEVLKNNHLNNKTTTDKEIIELCCKSEIYFEKEYRNVLNEYFPYNGLRDMLIYQLNGIKCAFMQLKLLKSVLWY